MRGLIGKAGCEIKGGWAWSCWFAWTCLLYDTVSDPVLLSTTESQS